MLKPPLHTPICAPECVGEAGGMFKLDGIDVYVDICERVDTCEVFSVSAALFPLSGVVFLTHTGATL
jgi:hypothetical protein